jgi:hypothetical protein
MILIFCLNKFYGDVNKHLVMELVHKVNPGTNKYNKESES